MKCTLDDDLNVPWMKNKLSVGNNVVLIGVGRVSADRLSTIHICVERAQRQQCTVIMLSNHFFFKCLRRYKYNTTDATCNLLLDNTVIHCLINLLHDHSRCAIPNYQII